MDQELISGTIAAVVFQNYENGYAVIKLDSPEHGVITVVGTIPLPCTGERLIVTGSWTVHNSYGKQFEAEFLERLLPDSTEEIFQYLSSRAVRGIGPKTAAKIVERFGSQSLHILDTEPQRLAEISGISLMKAMEMGENYRKQVGIRHLIEFMTTNHLPAEIAVRVYHIYGEDSMERIRSNPYLLSQPQFGADFSGTDMLALELGLSMTDPRRVDAGVLFVLRHNINNGHSFLPVDKLATATAAILSLEIVPVYEAIDRLLEQGYLAADTIYDLSAVYLPEFYEAEEEITERILSMTQHSHGPLPGTERFLDTIQRRHGISYAQLQREAIVSSAQERIMILTGGPGTGKTTTLAGILSMFELLGRKTLLAAPTGRAAKRLSELTGCEASTIHRLLEAQISPETGEMYFAKDQDDPLQCDALIIDEMSMVDLRLMHSVLRALPENSSLILVGDPDQLPSVGAGNVFADLIRCGKIKTIALTEIFRQARESLIVMNAHAVNRGMLPVLNDNSKDFFFMKQQNSSQVLQTVAQLCSTRLPGYLGISYSDIQVIAPSRKGETGTLNLNRVLQMVLNPQSSEKQEIFSGDRSFREGDRVMQIRNNYDLHWRRPDGTEGMGIFNGDCGIVGKIDRQNGCLQIFFDDREVSYDTDLLSELELAYAITAHKSQGCEYKAVVFVAFEAPVKLLTRSVLYTAMTRPKEMMVIVGNETVVADMTMNNHRNKRYSGLRFRLKELG
ncbi:MAG: ATP-dependent RecD-like DNA helicase [Oscillospiraceae bacterium]|nr:ATP-dependent RecD-like DNA helicase [Oscillospiraceae bacterium]